jgi:C-terminal processing protease CtpA/Prc
MRVTKRDGSPHHGVGIRPTVPVAPTLRGVKEGRDEVLERALLIVSESAN